MEQHPIPGAITTYKFKLVGDMTLKQFLELAAGVVSAWVLFNSGTNFIIKWTLGPTLAFFGFALAFLPIEDRPLDQWIINFVKAIYSPTQFLYRPKAKKLDIFEAVKKPAVTGPVLLKQGRGQLSEYLESLPPSSTSAFDQAEARYLEHIGNLFGALGNKIIPMVATKTKPMPTPPPARGGVRGIRVRQLLHPQMCLLPRAVVFQAPEENQTAAMPAAAKAPAGKAKPAPIKPPPKKKSVPPSDAEAVMKAIPPKAPAGTATVNPTFATDIPLPQKPERPNLIAGITLDKNGKIIPGVILEIRDNQGFPVRALKSNKLGQFFIATALEDGIYEISSEHEGHKFAIIKLEAKNEIIPPLKIQAVV